MYPRLSTSSHKFEGLSDGTSYIPVENYGHFGARIVTNCSFGRASLDMEEERYSEMHVNFFTVSQGVHCFTLTG